MLNVMVAGLLCISMLPAASSCNLRMLYVNFYGNKKTKNVDVLNGSIIQILTR